MKKREKGIRVMLRCGCEATSPDRAGELVGRRFKAMRRRPVSLSMGRD